MGVRSKAFFSGVSLPTSPGSGTQYEVPAGYTARLKYVAISENSGSSGAVAIQVVVGALNALVFDETITANLTMRFALDVVVPAGGLIRPYRVIGTKKLTLSGFIYEGVPAV